MVAAIVLPTAVASAGAYVYHGLYNIGADEKHWAIVEDVLLTVRLRSIDARARKIREIPDLTDPKLVSVGAGQYAEMCVNCHLAPGKKESPLRQGLYPQPPDLTLRKREPRAAFWTIKHGIKMTAMPAWGASHDDAQIWSIVAFLQELPGLDAKDYQRMIAEAPGDESMRDMPGTDNLAPMDGTRGRRAGGHHGANPHEHAK